MKAEDYQEWVKLIQETVKFIFVATESLANNLGVPFALVIIFILLIALIVIMGSITAVVMAYRVEKPDGGIIRICFSFYILCLISALIIMIWFWYTDPILVLHGTNIVM